MRTTRRTAQKTKSARKPAHRPKPNETRKPKAGKPKQVAASSRRASQETTPKAGRPRRASRSDIIKRYTPMERAILSAYLGIPDPKPGDLKGIDLKRSVDPEEWDEAKLGIAPMGNYFGGGRLMMENTVARLCLESVQKQLPQFAMWSGDRLILGRPDPSRVRRQRNLDPLPVCTINWADSAPGLSWPEAYFATLLPEYGVTVVTASSDSPDAHGYCDIAIGWFPGSETYFAGIESCITNWWRDAANQGQEQWAYILDTGVVVEDEVEEWAANVWPEQDRRTEEDQQ